MDSPINLNGRSRSLANSLTIISYKRQGTRTCANEQNDENKNLNASRFSSEAKKVLPKLNVVLENSASHGKRKFCSTVKISSSMSQVNYMQFYNGFREFKLLSDDSRLSLFDDLLEIDQCFYVSRLNSKWDSRPTNRSIIREFENKAC
jgi:hypothetical protein